MTDMTHQIDAQKRADYITGLRQLADLLEQHTDLPVPWTGSEYDPLQLAVWTTKEQLAVIVRALPAPVAKDASSDSVFRINAQLAGLHVSAYAGRAEVCERVVVGTETVEVPAQEAQPAVEAHTVEREVVRWDCKPLLGEDRLLAAVQETPSDPQAADRIRAKYADEVTS